MAALPPWSAWPESMSEPLGDQSIVSGDPLYAVQCSFVVGVECQDSAKISVCEFGLPHGHVHLGKASVSGDAIGFHGKRSIVQILGLRPLLLGGADICQAPHRHRPVQRGLIRPLELDGCGVSIMFCLQQISQVKVCPRVCRVELDGTPKMILRLVQHPLPQQQ